MSFQFYGEGKAGEVFIEDHRPDGSVVLLECTAQVSRAAGSRPSVSTGKIGVTNSSAPGGGSFPLLSEEGVVSRRLPKLHVNTTNMPGGILRFALPSFGRKALETAESGVREVTLTEEDAPDWGYLGQLTAARKGSADGLEPNDIKASSPPSEAASVRRRVESSGSRRSTKR